MEAIGVALFVDGKRPGDGYACDQDGVREIGGTHELSTDTLWITNIRPYDFIQGGFGQLRHLRSSNFFRTDIGYLIREWGLEGDLSEAATYLREVFNRSLSVILDRNPVSPSDSRTGLRQSLTEIIVPENISESLLDNAQLSDAVFQSIQYNQGRTGQSRVPAGSKICSFIVPRSVLASHLLSLPLPSPGKWAPVTFKSGVLRLGRANGRTVGDSQSEDAWQRLLDMADSKFFVLDIDVRETDRRMADHKSFGVGDRTSRHYATAEEVAEMSSYAVVDVRGGYCCDRSESPLAHPDMPDEFSISRALANEIYWLAVASNKSKSTPSPWAAYLRSVERIILGRAADCFTKKGFVVGSYGTGRVNVFLRSAEHQKASELALKLGLLPPYSYLNKPFDSDSVAFDAKLYYRDDQIDQLIGLTNFVDRLESDWHRMFVVAAALKGESPKDTQLELDQLLDLPEERRLASFEALAEKHLQGIPDPVTNSENDDESDDGLTF